MSVTFSSSSNNVSSRLGMGKSPQSSSLSLSLRRSSISTAIAGLDMAPFSRAIAAHDRNSWAWRVLLSISEMPRAKRNRF